MKIYVLERDYYEPYRVDMYLKLEDAQKRAIKGDWYMITEYDMTTGESMMCRSWTKEEGSFKWSLDD